MEYCIRPCMPDDLPVLQELSRRTFFEAFADVNTPEDMELYLAQAYNTQKLQTELLHKDCYFFFITAGDSVCGYLKLNDQSAQTEFHDARALEIERIYIAQAYQGCGLGNALIGKTVSMAKDLHKTYLWLGVWEKNYNAQRFYKSNGFYEIGRHDFYVGDDRQTDYILRKDL